MTTREVPPVYVVCPKCDGSRMVGTGYPGNPHRVCPECSLDDEFRATGMVLADPADVFEYAAQFRYPDMVEWSYPAWVDLEIARSMDASHRRSQLVSECRVIRRRKAGPVEVIEP